MAESSRIALIRRAYDVFNARDLDAAMTMLDPEVEWPNGMEGGYVHGHQGVRDYWTRQWGMIDPHVEPITILPGEDGRITVTARQTIRALAGALLNERTILHHYTLEDDLITRMEIEEPAD